jgi:hypothetical protein
MTNGPSVCASGGHQRRAQALEEEEVGEQADQRQQRQRDVGADCADGDCEDGNQQQPRRRGEVAEVLRDIMRPADRRHNVWRPI